MNGLAPTTAEEVVLQQKLDAAALELRELEQEVGVAAQDAARKGKLASRLHVAIVYRESIVKFRAVEERYQLWPLGIAICLPFALGALAWTVGFTLGFSVAAMWCIGFVAAALAWAGCVHLLWFPTTSAIEYRLIRLRQDDKIRKAAFEAAFANKLQVERRRAQVHATVAALNEELRELKQRQLEKQLAEQEAIERYRQSQEFRGRQLLQSNWRDMRAVEFEQFLKFAFEIRGYDVELTSVTGDQGVDLVVTRNGRRIAIQAKGYAGRVGNDAVQQVFAGMAHYRCHSCAVITNSHFTHSAKTLAASVHCLLIDNDAIPAFVMGKTLI